MVDILHFEINSMGIYTDLPLAIIAAMLAFTITTKQKTSILSSNVIGNLFNILSVISVIYNGYNYATIDTKLDPPYYGTPPVSKEFYKDGFCVKNRFETWHSTHTACFFVDILLSAILFMLMKLYKNEIQARDIESNYLKPLIPISTIVHGCGHLFISFVDTNDPTPPTNLILWITAGIYFLVFWALFAASSPTFGSNTTYAKLGYSTTLTYTLNTGALALSCAVLAALFWRGNPNFHSIQVGFTYVQTLVIVYAAVIQLLVLPKTEKKIAYAAWSGIVTFMVNVVGWWIALDCEKNVLGLDKSLLDVWGHLWYDSYLATSYIMFLFFALKFIPTI